MENFSYIFGIVPKAMFTAMLLFSLVGVITALLIDSQKRDQNSASTPKQFSWVFLLKDNWKTIMLSVICVVITLRFAPLLVPDYFTMDALDTPRGIDKWLFGAWGIGLTYNSLAQFLKDKWDMLKVRKPA
jgi:hypothetical protein